MKVGLWFLTLAADFIIRESQAVPSSTEEGSWSKCSVTCGEGYQTKQQTLNKFTFGEIKNQTIRRSCNLQVCPSYLGWPRIHFYGTFVANCPTTNNFRCFFNNDKFCPVCNTFRLTTATEVKFNQAGPTVHRYGFQRGSADPMGNGHFYFVGAKVTSACWKPGQACLTKDPIVGRKVTDKNTGRMVDLDPDWQLASEVIGYRIHIPGVFTALMESSSFTQMTSRVIGQSDGALSAIVKSKLTDINWIDSFYKSKFEDSSRLSIIFVMDLFTRRGQTGRLTGTIGMTSPDDPKSVHAGRSMHPLNLMLRPNYEIGFYFDEAQDTFVVDFSNVMKCNRYGTFISNGLKYLDLAIYPAEDDMDYFVSHLLHRATTCGLHSMFMLTQGGALNYLYRTQQWYTVFGGVVQIRLSSVNWWLRRSISRGRVALVNRLSLNKRVGTPRKEGYSICLLYPHLCRVSFHQNCHLLSIEAIDGLNVKPMASITKRLSRGETWEFRAIATKFGRPLQDASVSLQIMKQPFPVNMCTKGKDSCSPYLARPRSVLKLSPSCRTDINGIAQITVAAIHNPGNARKCKLDGQIYPTSLILETQSRNRVIRIGSGGTFATAMNPFLNYQAKKQCHLHDAHYTYGMAIKVFTSLPMATMRKQCPTWNDDVKPIFQFYYNMFPVMEKHDVINLRNIHDVRSKLRMINMSMFEYDWSHPNFMPTTRDLSPDKTEIVRRWLECEMNGNVYKTKLNESTSYEYHESRHGICGSADNLQKTMEEIRNIIQMGIWVELYTIPPYMTAMLSLKREKFKEVYNILKSISTEEMLHVVLNANVLNSVGGKPNMTDSLWLPNYPTPFPSKDFYEIRPDVVLKLEPFSISLVKEVFMEIEKPASPSVMKIIHQIANLWNEIPTDKGGKCALLGKNASLCENPYWFEKSKGKVKNKFKSGNWSNSKESLWQNLFKFSTDMLDQPEITDVYTIGGFYAHAMLRLIQAEACVKMDSINNTVFTGDPTRQFGPEQWYVTKGLSSATLFPVHGLKSAIEALMEVVYEGEGGTPCAPFVTDIAENDASHNSVNSPYQEKSHYIKFQEIANGRKIIPLGKKEPQWPQDTCMPYVDVCADLTRSNISSNSKYFCYLGERISVRDTNRDIWPISRMKRPTNILAYTAILRFNQIYTSLLDCLEMSMNGSPKMMSTCTGIMYELLGAGKNAVTTPLYTGGDPTKGPNVTPTWSYILDHYKFEGFTEFIMPKTSHVFYC